MKTRMLIAMLGAVALLAACKGKTGGYEVVNTDSKKAASSADTAAMADTTKVATQLVKTAEISLKVKSVQQVSESIASLTGQYGGMVMRHQIETNVASTRDVNISNDSVMRVSAFSTTGNMTVKVPALRLEEFMTKISHMGIYVNENKMDIDDKSLEYLSSELKLKDRRNMVAQQQAGRITIKNPANVLALKDDMVDEQINNMRINNEVKFSMVDLSFYQSNTIMKETIANDDPSAYGIPFFSSLRLAFANGWDIFTEMLIGLVNLWMFIATGVAIWLVIRHYKKHVKTTNQPVL